ncbi:ATP-binding protein [Mycolicibacterium sp. 018/SC-01/001]|uniref:sensor histidine kinase n=1 Tax=Mycolicibacterium sp. 018/SC-01/001 TaxID=2592069 RepID=UPI00117E436F|nr:ATP-binding protein [Mycolicibacterium sp. 018/SC-01/001]TRW86200.1 ATP-binding protein [Mycolicibacterium sp. 018/SC-01/001]
MPTKPKNSSPGRIGAAALDDAQQRHLIHRAKTIGLLMRHCINAGASMIALADPKSGMTLAGQCLVAALLGWSLYRLATQSHGPVVTAVDVASTIAICFGIPLLVHDPLFQLSNSAPQAIAGTAVISFAVSLPALLTFAITLVIAGAYAVGAAEVVGWGEVGSIRAVYYFALQWTTASLIRFMLLRVAAAVDQARRARESAETARAVEEGVRVFAREQMALLHDTAASTLLIVGQGVDLPANRLADQARRDLDILERGPWCSTSTPLELVSALRAVSNFARTRTVIEGRATVWLDGSIAHAVIAATRETLNNIDRHARAKQVRIVVGSESLSLIDDGIGFDQADVSRRHGITESIVGRMYRVGGSATVTSAPGRGTIVDLRWTPEAPLRPTLPEPMVLDRQIQRIRATYVFALTFYVVANLVTTVPYAASHTGHFVSQIALAAVAGTCALLALPGLENLCRLRIPVGLSALLMVMLTHSVVIVPPHMLGTQADWAQGGIGWCVVVLVLALRTWRAATILTAFWLTASIIELCLRPEVEAVTNLGYGTASILGVQLFALVFDGLMRDAAAEVGTEVAAHRELLISEKVAQAVAQEYRRRYAELIDSVVPLLRQLANGDAITGAVRREARAQSRRLRALFDQSTTFEHPLMQRLRLVVDAVESRHIDVAIKVSTELPYIDDCVAERLARSAALVLEMEMVSAQLVIGSAGQRLSLSLVCRGLSEPVNSAEALAAIVGDVVVSEDSVWCVFECAIGQ